MHTRDVVDNCYKLGNDTDQRQNWANKKVNFQFSFHLKFLLSRRYKLNYSH